MAETSQARTGDLVRARDIIGNLAVRKLCGRAVREDKKAITRHTLISWRASFGFPAPLKTPQAGVELWSRPEVKAWLERNGRRPGE